MSALLYAKRLFMIFMVGGAITVGLVVYANLQTSIDLAIVSIFSACITAFCLVLAVVCCLHASRFSAVVYSMGTTVLLAMANYMYSVDTHPALLLSNMLYGSILVFSVLVWLLSKLNSVAVVAKPEKNVQAKHEKGNHKSIEDSDDAFLTGIDIETPSSLFDTHGSRIHASGYYGAVDILEDL